MMRIHRKTPGFTLLELMIAIAAFTVILVMGVPALSHTIDRNRMSTSIDGVANALHTARAFAVSDGVDTTVCGSSTGTSCDGKWSRGWIVVENRSGQPGTVGSGDSVVKAYPRLAHGFTLAPSFSGNGYVYYHPNGLAGWGGHLTLCGPAHSGGPLAVVVSPSGNVRESRTTGSGGALSCP